MSGSKLPESIRVTLVVVRLLDRMGVRYAIGGSLASSVHGEARATAGVNLIAELRNDHVGSLLSGLGSSFHSDEARVRDAVARAESFQLIHQETMFKVDMIVAREQPLEMTQIERRVSVMVDPSTGESAFFCSPEDTVLAKLLWHRKSAKPSGRHWRDVLGVLRAQREKLDTDYLTSGGDALGVADALQDALKQAGTNPT